MNVVEEVPVEIVVDNNFSIRKIYKRPDTLHQVTEIFQIWKINERTLRVFVYGKRKKKRKKNANLPHSHLHPQCS